MNSYDKFQHYLSGVATTGDMMTVVDQEIVCDVYEFSRCSKFSTNSKDDCFMNQVDESHSEKTSSYQVWTHLTGSLLGRSRDMELRYSMEIVKCASPFKLNTL